MPPADPTSTRARIHPAAHVDAAVQLGSGVTIGPGAVLEGDIRIGDRCRIGPNAVFQGPLEIGDDCAFGPMTCIGLDPQVKDNDGPFGHVRIGARNVFRELSQVHRAMKPDGTTVIGDEGFFMANAHIAHDCVVHGHVVMVNNTMLAGHVEVFDRAFLSGGSGIHQFSRVGTLAMVGGNTAADRDVPPYGMIVSSRPALLKGLNMVGLRRAGFASDTREAIKAAYRVLFRSQLALEERLEAVDASVPEVAALVDFIRESKRGVIGFGGGGGSHD